uniref:Kinetochore protein Nuf2 n=1 Tax=Panagrolaimus sp. PS1159 TaxID=55785 RepID=A0AC35GCT9_9BILA
MSQEAEPSASKKKDVVDSCPNYEQYRVCLPSEAIPRFILLMLREFPDVFELVLHKHDVIHMVFEGEEDGCCSVIQAITKVGGCCKYVINSVANECLRFCNILNTHHFVTDIQVKDFELSDVDLMKEFHAFFKDFLKKFVVELNVHSKNIGPILRKLLDEYYEEKKKQKDVPKIAAQNHFQLEKRQNDLRIKFDTIVERNQKRRARIQTLTTTHKKLISQGENFRVKAQSLNVQKKTVDDIIAKTSEKEAEMEKMNKLLAVLKHQLSDVKENGIKQQETRNREKEAKKAKQRKTSVAIIKAERERIQELDLSILELRLENIKNFIDTFVTTRTKEISHMYLLMEQHSKDEQKVIFEKMEGYYNQMKQEKERFQKLEAAYEKYKQHIKEGTLLADLPAIDLPIQHLQKI